MRTFFVFLLSVILASYASADAITDINLWVGVDGNTHVEEKLVIDESGKTWSNAVVPRPVNDLTVADSLGKLDYNVIHGTGYDTINFSFPPLGEDDEKTVWIKYGTPHLTKKEGVNWTISFFSPATSRRTIVRVNFPLGASFVSLKPEKLLRSYDKYAVWIFPQEEYLDFNCTYVFSGTVESQPNATGNSSLSVPSDNGWLNPVNMVIGLVVLLLVFGLLFLGLRMELFKKEITKKDEVREAITVNVQKEEDMVKGPSIVGDSLSYDIEGVQKKGRKKVKDSILKMLDDKEMAVVKILENSEEEVTQAYVHKTIGLPKSSLSDVIKRLEKRNILETSSQGRVKWLMFQKWVLE